MSIRSGDPGAAVVRPRVGRETTLVQQHDDRLDAFFFRIRTSLLAVSISSVKSQALDAGLGDDVRGVLQRHTDEPDLAAVLEGLDLVRREQRLLGVLEEHVRRQVLELRARERLRGWGRGPGCSAVAVRQASTRSASGAARASPRRTRGYRRRRSPDPSRSAPRPSARRGTLPTAAARRRSGHPRRP